MRNSKRKNNIIIGGLLAIALVMGIGYAAFSSKLSINGTGSVSSNFDVKITGITSKNIVGKAGNKINPTYTDTTATFYTTLQSPGDSITYDITVANNGTFDAILNDITTTNGNNSAITFETSGLSQGDSLLKGETKTLTVKVTYNSSVTSQPSNTTNTLKVTLTFGQKGLDSSGIAIPGKTGTDLKELVTTTGDGLYSDSTEEGSFYYSGSNPDNAIVFNGEPYRILRIEKDGRIKIIKMVSTASTFWNTGGSNVWAEASLKKYLEGTWLSTQSSGEDYQYLSTNNEWYAGGVPNSNSYNSDFTKAYSVEKQTVVNSPTGLISVSEFLKSKSVETEVTFLNYKSSWWTISPYSTAFACTWGILNGSLNSYSYSSSSYSLTVFPVLYLKSDTPLTGTGTSSDPYCVKGSSCPTDLNFSMRVSN